MTEERAPEPQPAPTFRPDLPVEDEWGLELEAFRCWKCGRTDYIYPTVAKYVVSIGGKLYCLPCEEPANFRWEVETVNGEKRDRLVPLTQREITKRSVPGDKLAKELFEKRAVVRLLRERHLDLAKQLKFLTGELERNGTAMAEAERDIVRLEPLVAAELQSRQADGERKKIDKLEKVKRLRERIAQLQKDLGLESEET